MKFLVNTEIDRNKWEVIVENNPFASPFQTPNYFDFINAVPGYRAMAVAIEEEDKYYALAVVTLQKECGIKGYFSRRGIIYGGPLFDPDCPEANELLLVKLVGVMQKLGIYFETRNFFDYGNQREGFSRYGWKYIPYYNFHLKLSGKSLENILSGMDYNRKREIKISIKEGATYAECQNDNDLKALYFILAELYKARVRLPLPPFDFFNAFYRFGIGKIFIIKHNNVVIGGSFCPILANRAIYTFYYCGIRDYHKKIFPTHLAVLAAIEYGVKNNIDLLDFMGAGKPDLEYGVRKYKKEFGGELVEHGRFLKVTQPFLYRIGNIGLSILEKFH